ncbi:MAG TPA: hypothetical protein VH370_07560 [Humisphaera sp.]|nr:hypothetical protein [Humisphaera sp.]
MASLLLALALAGLWIRSYFVADSIGHGLTFTGSGGVSYLRFVAVGSEFGKIGFARGYVWEGAGGDIHSGWNLRHDHPAPPRSRINTPLWSVCGFTYSPFDIQSVVSVRLMEIPDWFVTMVAALPAAWLGYRALRRKNPAGCPACGYNLTGNISGICPECGRQTPTAG